MFFTVKKLYNIIRFSKISNINKVSFLILANSLFEVLSIGILIPFIAVILKPEFFNEIKIYLNSLEYFDFESLIQMNEKQFILFLGYFTLILYIIKYSINILYNWYLQESKINYEKIIGLKILENLSITSNLTFLELPMSRILSDITMRLRIVSQSIIYLINFFTEILIFTILYISLVYKFKFNAILVLVIVFLLFGFIYYFYKNIVKKLSFERGKGGDDRNKNLIDYLTGIREVIIYSAKKYFLDEFEKNNKKFLDPQKKILFFNSLPKILIESVFVFLFLILFLYSVIKNFDTEELILTTSIIFILTVRLLPSLYKIIVNLNSYKFCSEAIIGLEKFIVSTKANFQKHDKLTFKKFLKFENVCFSFKEKEILSNINLKINKNSKIGLVGSTGSGKSTLIDLIIGLLEPKKGKYFIDNLSSKEINIKGWMQNISYVPQKIFLFNSSIRQNITFKADDDQIDLIKFNNVIELSGLSELLQNNNEKEFFQIGEFGKKISGGQKQKIGIARALYKDASLIIFDESTNALDENSEKNIVNNILSLKEKTIVFITHNLNILENFDSVYELKNNQINEKMMK